MYCSEYFNVFEYLVWTSHEIKKVGGILTRPASKKGKTITTETLHLIPNVYEDDRCLKRKTMSVWVKEYIIKNFASCKSLSNLLELYTDFKEKHPNVNIGFSKFCALRPKWVAGSKMTHCVCSCSAHQNVGCNGLGLDIQRPDQINFVLP